MLGTKKLMWQQVCWAAGLLLVLLVPVSAQSLTITKSGDITVTALVPTPPPSTAPTIDSPVSGTTFDVKNIQISGDCITDLIVKIFDNDQFIGSSLCTSSGTYQLSADLVENTNILVARQYDSFNQPSPPSPDTIVYFVPPASQPSLPSGPISAGTSIATFELKIDYNYLIQNVFAGEPFYLPIHFVGGSPPYAVNIDWGDGQNGLFSRQNTDQFTTDHTYNQPGIYTVKIKVSDRVGNQAFVQFVLVVNGTPSLGVVHTPFGDIRTVLSIPLLTLIIILIGLLGVLIGYWFGRFVGRDKRKNKQQKTS